MNPLFSALSQTWPARAVKSLYEAAKHPGEVYAGRADPMDVEKATDLAGLAMTGGLGGLGGMSRQGVVGSGPIRAYHGSPHDFDRFDLSKIGTGEGAQAYGHGLYFAENEGVARGYRDALKFKGSYDANADMLDPKRIAGELYETWGGDIKGALDDARFYDNSKGVIAALKSLHANPPKGKMYEVAIHADPERFLDWDKLPKEQPKAARKIMRAYDLPNDFTVGSQLDRYVGPGWEDELKGAGIPGIKYLDQGSRTAGDGSRNYVTFSDNIVEILRKYGIVGGLGGLGGMQAMQEPRT